MRFTLTRTSPDPGRAGLYAYGPASIWISGPAGGVCYATVRFRSQEIDLDARDLDGALEAATRWVDDAPELTGWNCQASLNATIERDARCLDTFEDRR